MNPRTLTLGIAIGLLTVGIAQADDTSPILLTSPQDYQVFQRQSKNQGTIRIEGTLQTGSSLQARLDSSDWQPVPIDPQTKRFHADLPTKSGGWYALHLRATDKGKATAETTVPHVGVGEIFIVAGQSNSCNYGSEKQKTATGKVVAFDGARWQLAADPQPGGGGTGGSFMPPFGDALVEKYNVPVAVVACGVGSTSVREWLPRGSIISKPPTTGRNVRRDAQGHWIADGPLFNNLIKRVDHFGPQGFRAILWHQGESDDQQPDPARQITAREYSQYLRQLIAATADQAKWPVPWFTAHVTYHSEKAPADDEFRAAQKSLWDDGIALQGPDTDALRKDYRAGVHFNGKGLQAHGKLWAEKVEAYLEKCSSISDDHPHRPSETVPPASPAAAPGST